MRQLSLIVLIVVGCSNDSPLNKIGDSDASAVLADTQRDVLARDAADLDSPDTSRDISLADMSTDASVPEDLTPRLSNALSQTPIGGEFTGLGTTFPTDASNGLPFLSVSYNLTEAYLHYVHLDAIIENGALNVTRDEDPMVVGEFISVSGHVVDFDPTRFKITCEPFQTGYLYTTISFPDGFDPATSFSLFWNKISTGSNNKSVAHFSNRFLDDNAVYLERVSPDGTALGHVCLVESLDGSFGVQHVTSSIVDGETAVTLPISAVDTSRSIVFASHQATRVESKPGYSQISCRLTTDNVLCERTLNEYEIFDLRVQVVTFADRTTVEHLTVTIPDGTAEVVIDVPGMASTDVVLLGQQGVLGEVATSADHKAYVPSSYVEAIAGDGHVTFRRGPPMVGTMTFYPQVVRF